MASRNKKEFSVNRSWAKLLGASVLLNVIVVAGLLTATPTVSPAATWETGFWKAYYKVRPVSAADLAMLHDKSSTLRMEQCVACHGNMLSSKLELHRIHLGSDLLPGLTCPVCHTSISLEKRSNLKVVRLVDVGVCKKCHSAFPGLQPNSPMKPSDFKADCTTCHSGSHAPRHEAPYLSHVIAPSECAGCHGGRVLPWVPAHELDSWVQVHGRVALKLGVAECMKCHEHGLEFCDTCHKLKPPSHLPRGDWLAKHPAAARADTRACFTCHTAASCKRCHVNHTPNWLDTHFNFVMKNGADGCMACHSETFCSGCHVAFGTTGSLPSTTTTP